MTTVHVLACRRPGPAAQQRVSLARPVDLAALSLSLVLLLVRPVRVVEAVVGDGGLALMLMRSSRMHTWHWSRTVAIVVMMAGVAVSVDQGLRAFSAEGAFSEFETERGLSDGAGGATGAWPSLSVITPRPRAARPGGCTHRWAV